MKIYKIISLSIALILSTNLAYWNFWSTSTFVNWEKTFDKVHWEDKVLYVHEDYVLNPYSWSNITRNQVNNVTNSYTVDGRRFNSSHPKYKNNWDLHQSWTDHWDGTKTMIQYLENTYTRDSNNILMPNQQVNVRKYYKVDFNYDNTGPTGWDLKLYNDEDATEPFSYTPWEWLNEPKYYTMTCKDLETWCKCEFEAEKISDNWWTDSNNHACTNSTELIKINWQVKTIPSIIWHKTKPSVTFENNVNLKETITWSMPGWKTVMYDQSNPRIWLWVTKKIGEKNVTVHDFDLWKEENREYRINPTNGKKYDWEQIPWKVYFEWKKKIELKANDEFKLWTVFLDQYIEDSSNWVSWIKNYNIKIYKENNTWWYNQVYDFWKSYTEYNSDWTIEENDEKWKMLHNFWTLKNAWKYKIVLESKDWANNHTIATAYLNIYPEWIDEANIEMDYSLASSSNFANNSDYYEYTFTIKDKYNNPVYWKELDIIWQDCSWITTWGCNELKTNTVENTWESWIIIYDISNNSITDKNWEVKLKIKSLAPWKYTNSFLVKINNWNKQYINTSEIIDFYVFSSEETEFIAPIEIDSIKVSNDNINWDAQPEIWKEQKYKIQLNNTWSVNWYSDWILKLSKESINSKIDWHFWIDFSWVERSFGNNINTFLWFSWTIDWSENLLKGPEIENDELEINYNIDNKNVAYFLGSKSIKWCDRETLWLKVEWNIQWDGKSDITWQEENFSDLSMSETRSQIRQNAYQLIRNMSNWQIINWVKYVEWDYVLESNPSNYETLILKDWNLIVNKDINNNDNKLWIIVLKDNYNVSLDYKNAGNIYIANNVNYISASLYSDWAIRSAKSNGIWYNDSELLNDLEIFWSVFTRNTIGGAVNWWTSYTLPGWKETTDYKLASIYDLNYLRKSASCWDEYSLLIKYNPDLQVNPPAWFTK